MGNARLIFKENRTEKRGRKKEVDENDKDGQFKLVNLNSEI